MINIEDFDWGISSDWYKNTIGKELFIDKIYENYVKVEEGDVVVDLGASIGPFPYSIKHIPIKHIYCFEPSPEQLPTLINNVEGMPCTVIPKGISDKEGGDVFELYGSTHKEEKALSTSFKSFVKEYNIDKIDFLKTDCEGGEYNVFNIENIWWVKQNIKKVVGEFHLGPPELNQKFRQFRDVYLRMFKKYEVYSVDGIDIKWDLWNEHFLEYYKTILIYIDNR